MKKYFLSIATLFLLSLVIGGANVIADNSDDIDYDQIKEQMRQDGSSENDIENVIKKIKRRQNTRFPKNQKMKTKHLSQMNKLKNK